MPTLLLWTLRALGQLPLPLLHGLGWLLGNLLWLVPNAFRAVTRRHLEMCFPERSPAERARIARRSLIESGKAVCESPALWFGPSRRLRRWIGGDEAAIGALHAAVAGGRGAIMLTPHLGAWEIASFFCAQAGPITVLYKPQKGAFDALILRGRSRLGVTPVPTTGGGVKALLGALKRGELVGILPDHDPPDESGTRFAPLFGIPANTMDLIGKLAARSGAPVWFIMAERLSWGRGFRFHLERAAAGIADPDAGAAVLNQGVEACVTRFPEQYWWSYKRYRRRPPGAADPYLNLR